MTVTLTISEGVRKRFTPHATHGELQLLTTVGDAGKEFANLYVQRGDRAVYARFSVNDLYRRPNECPATIDAWKQVIRAMLSTWLGEGRAMPLDAVEFGFSDDEIAASHAAYDVRCKARLEKREAKEAERKKLEQDAERSRMEKLHGSVLADTQITGDELVDVARSLNLDVHPRTVGMLRNRVRRINSHTSYGSGKGGINSAYRLYRQSKDLLTAISPKGENNEVRSRAMCTPR